MLNSNPTDLHGGTAPVQWSGFGAAYISGATGKPRGVHLRGDYLVLLLGVPPWTVADSDGMWGCGRLMSCGRPGPSGPLALFFL